MNFEDWEMKMIKIMKNIGSQKTKLTQFRNVHSYLDNLPQIGKVLSFSSIIDVATQLNNNKPPRNFRNGCFVY